MVLLTVETKKIEKILAKGRKKALAIEHNLESLKYCLQYLTASTIGLMKGIHLHSKENLVTHFQLEILVAEKR